MNELCVSCHYARMRDDVCGIYCTGGFVESNGKCRHYKDCEEEQEETGGGMMAEYIKREDAIKVINGQSVLTMSRKRIIDQINVVSGRI